MGDRESSNLLSDGNERANNKNNIDNTNITNFTSHDDEPNKIFSCDTCGMKFPVKLNYTTVDVDPESETFSQVISRLHFPYIRDETHHSGWNACSSCYNDPTRSRSRALPDLRNELLYIWDGN